MGRYESETIPKGCTVKPVILFCLFCLPVTAFVDPNIVYEDDVTFAAFTIPTTPADIAAMADLDSDPAVTTADEAAMNSLLTHLLITPPVQN